jgi:hypothetical protein
VLVELPEMVKVPRWTVEVIAAAMAAAAFAVAVAIA